jgi:hypothetical protein
MQDTAGRPTVELTINGRGPYRFILDTGATLTVLNDRLVRELSLSAPAPGQTGAVADRARPPTIEIHEIRVGDAVLSDVIAAVAPTGMFPEGGDAPQGVLSAASFPGYLLTYDYARKRVSIRKGSLPPADSMSVFQYREDQVLPTVPVRVGGHEADVHLDTGSPAGLTLPLKFLTELPLVAQPKESGTIRTAGGGEFPIWVAQVGGVIEIGRYALDAGEVSFSDARPGPGAPTGNIGYQVLRRFVVTVDSRNRRVKLDQ